MNSNKFCFISCVNDSRYAKECIYYINHLTIPKGYEVDILTISDAASMFEDESIGMAGMVGSPKLPDHAVMWYGDRVGRIYTSNVVSAGISIMGGTETLEVEAVDGLLIATQYDIPWREDLFTGWDFYDVSQSFEFRRKGYRVVVPAMADPWCIHDDGFLNLSNYYKERRKFLAEYGAKQNG